MNTLLSQKLNLGGGFIFHFRVSASPKVPAFHVFIDSSVTDDRTLLPQQESNVRHVVYTTGRRPCYYGGIPRKKLASDDPSLIDVHGTFDEHKPHRKSHRPFHFRMGRVKLKIKRLESIGNRQVTYSKRRSGILKKARELSILCDIDIVLLMFSPNGRPTLFHGRSNIEEVILKFCQQTPQERAKRKLESLEALRKTFKKLDHDVNIQDFLGTSSQTAEELTEQANFMRVQLTELHKILSYWGNPDKIDNIEHLRQMEDTLRESINRIDLHKENFGKCQLMPLDCTNQFQNGMPLSWMMSGLPETQPLSWLPNNGNQHLLLSNGPKFLHHGDMECSADTSVPGYFGYFSTEKQTEMGNSTLVDNMGQEGGALSELSSSAFLTSQLGDQFSYPPYGSLDLPDDKKFKPDMEMNVQGNSSVFQVNSNFEPPRAMYDNGHHAWAPASGPCEIALFRGNSYH